jgi:shikimate dehydrogenase
MKIVLIGWPVAHSISPAMQNAAFRAAQIDGEYSLLPVERPEDLEAKLSGLRKDPDWRGANVTVPYKETVVPLLDGLEGAAARLKAVNTIVRRSGRLTGCNTDMPGFLADLDRRGIAFRGRGAVVIGSGGAARSVVAGLVESGCAVSVVAVLPDQARALAEEVGGGKVEVLSWEDPAIRERAARAGLIVNASPVGMRPKTDESPWPADLPLPSGAAVYDLVYTPQETAFLKRARADGLRAAGGLGMLVEQGALAFEMWTGAAAPRDAMMAAAKSALNREER